ncbi:MAG: cytochrome P450 [Marinobacterium sp.]|nr:cytochrome P450 [Marinobacterium sp.]
MNLLHLDLIDNPYPAYAEMRKKESPAFLPYSKGTEGGIWLFSRYDDCLSIFKQTTTVSKQIRPYRPSKAQTPFDLHMLNQDGKRHLFLRRLVAHYFSAKSLQSYTPLIKETTLELINEIKPKDMFDFMTDFAEPLPLLTISRIVGFPTEDIPEIRRLSIIFCDLFDSTIQCPDSQKKSVEALKIFIDYINRLINNHSHIDDGSMLSFLITTQKSGEITKDELIAMIGLLLFAGHETTVSLLGSGLWLLLTHSTEWEKLKNNPSLSSSAVEEMLRYESPEQRSSFRVAKESFSVNGYSISPGQHIGAIIGAANRDESIFTDAGTFNISRTPNKHLAFGIGQHHCIGKTLARNQAIIAFDALQQQLPDIQLITDKPNWRKNSFLRSLSSLYIKGRTN